MTHRIYLSIIAVMLFIILFMHYCTPKSKETSGVVTVIDTVYTPETGSSDWYKPVKKDSFPAVIAKFKSVPKYTPVAQYKPDKKQDKKAYISPLTDSLSDPNPDSTIEDYPVFMSIYQDTLKLNNGEVIIIDSVYGDIVSRKYIKRLSNPTVTSVSSKKKRNQWFVGPQIMGTSISPIRYAGGSLLILNKKDVLYKVDIMSNLKGEMMYGGGIFFKMKLGK